MKKIERRFAKIPVFLADPWPGDHSSNRGYFKVRDRGMLIFVKAPIAPNENWHCGTKLVWPVHDDTMLELWGSLPSSGEVCVCEHQIIIDLK